jgi:hypothetical protein
MHAAEARRGYRNGDEVEILLGEIRKMKRYPAGFSADPTLESAAQGISSMRFLQSIGAFLSTLLPKRYRRGTPPHVCAMASGIVQGLVCVFLLIFRFLWFSETGGELLDRGHAFDLFVRFGGEYVQANMVAGLARFWLSPLNFFLVYLVFEAVLRIMAALTSGQIIPTLPFYAVAGIHGLIEKAAYKRRLGDLIPDQVFRGNEKQGFALKIYSSRAKSHWNSYMTIEFEGIHYQLMREESAPAPRHYALDDVMKTH